MNQGPINGFKDLMKIRIILQHIFFTTPDVCLKDISIPHSESRGM